MGPVTCARNQLEGTDFWGASDRGRDPRTTGNEVPRAQASARRVAEGPRPCASTRQVGGPGGGQEAEGVR